MSEIKRTPLPISELQQFQKGAKFILYYARNYDPYNKQNIKYKTQETISIVNGILITKDKNQTFSWNLNCPNKNENIIDTGDGFVYFYRYLGDQRIRQEFKNQILLKIQEQCLIFDEMGVLGGTSIVDLAIITQQSLEGFEIKSAEDSLIRLPNQVACYNQIFDFNTLITVPEFIDASLKIIPEFWGVITVKEEGKNLFFFEYRRPQANPFINKRKILELLWKIEAQALLHELNFKGYHKFRVKKLWDTIDSKLSLPEIKQYIYKYISQRDKLWKKSLK